MLRASRQTETRRAQPWPDSAGSDTSERSYTLPSDGELGTASRPRLSSKLMMGRKREESRESGGSPSPRRPWPQCQGGCGRRAGCRDLCCDLKSPLRARHTQTPGHHSPSSSIHFPARSSSVDGSSPSVHQLAYLDEEFFNRKETLELDHSSPHHHHSYHSSSSSSTKSEECTFTEVENELASIEQRASLGSSQNTNTDMPSPPTTYSRRHGRQDTPRPHDRHGNGVPLQAMHAEFRTAGESEDSAYSELTEGDGERGPPTHALLLDARDRSCGRVAVVFGLMPGAAQLPGGGTAPALVAQPVPHHSAPQNPAPQHPAPQYAAPQFAATAPARGSRQRPPLPQASEWGTHSSEWEGTVRAPEGGFRPDPRMPHAEGRSVPAGYTLNSERRPRSLRRIPAERLNYPVPPLPPPSPALPRAMARAPTPDPRGISPYPVLASEPPRDNPWDDALANELYECAYSALSRAQRKRVQRLKVARGSQQAASGTKGLAKEHAGAAREAVGRAVHTVREKRRVKRDRRMYSDAQFEKDAQGMGAYAPLGEPPNPYVSYAGGPPAPPRAHTYGYAGHEAREPSGDPNGALSQYAQHMGSAGRAQRESRHQRRTYPAGEVYP